MARALPDGDFSKVFIFSFYSSEMEFATPSNLNLICEKEGTFYLQHFRFDITKHHICMLVRNNPTVPRYYRSFCDRNTEL